MDAAGFIRADENDKQTNIKKFVENFTFFVKIRHIIYAIQNRLSCEPAFVYVLHIQCEYRDKPHLLILWKAKEVKSTVKYNRLITLQHGHFRRVRRMKNGGVWRRLAGSLLGTRQIYLCGAVS